MRPLPTRGPRPNPALILPFLLLLCAADARAGDPLSGEYRKMGSKGYAPAEKASARIGGSSRLVAVVYGSEKGSDYLKLYRVSDGKPRLVFLEPGFSKKLSLASIHEGGGIPDLIGDGSLILAYNIRLPAVEQESLKILRYDRGMIKEVDELPFGYFEDLDEDGRLEIVSRERPLGPWFRIECESFHSMAQTAFRTSVRSFDGPKLMNVSRRFEGFFRENIRETEAELRAVDPRSTDDYGGYLGSALSLYFYHEELGEKKIGWRKFEGLFPVRRTDPGKVKRCMKQMEDTLKDRLGIPEDW